MTQPAVVKWPPFHVLRTSSRLCVTSRRVVERDSPGGVVAVVVAMHVAGVSWQSTAVMNAAERRREQVAVCRESHLPWQVQRSLCRRRRLRGVSRSSLLPRCCLVRQEQTKKRREQFCCTGRCENGSRFLGRFGGWRGAVSFRCGRFLRMFLR